jgi:hypothetical protein
MGLIARIIYQGTKDNPDFAHLNDDEKVARAEKIESWFMFSINMLIVAFMILAYFEIQSQREWLQEKYDDCTGFGTYDETLNITFYTPHIIKFLFFGQAFLHSLT